MSLELKLTSAKPADADTDCIVVGVFEKGVLSSAAASVDAASDGALRKLIDSGDINGRIETHLWLYALAGLKASRVLVVGLGAQKGFDARRYQRAAQHAGSALASATIDDAISWFCELDVTGRDSAWRVRVAALAADHAVYTFKISSKNGKDAPKRIKSLAFAADSSAATGLDQARSIANGVRLARDLGNTPPNICTPAWLAEQAGKIAEQHEGVEIEVLEPDALRELGANALLAVGEGSANTPRLIVLQWKGAGDAKPFALVGKGVTFDSGGINIKPSPGMEEMKFDMCGAAGVLGAFLATVEMKLALNLVCVVPSAENMPGGKSYRPSDVLTSLSGITIEVLNTDAEGRLILCDALTYTRRFEPQVMVDAATLTGACVVALGKHATGLMSADDDLANELLAAGEDSMDRAWRLPLWDDYQQQLESGTADVANIGGKYAGAITAGCFLSRFTDGIRWAHLDIAGTAWTSGRKAMATGRPVALLAEWLIGKAS